MSREVYVGWGFKLNLKHSLTFIHYDFVQKPSGVSIHIWIVYNRVWRIRYLVLKIGFCTRFVASCYRITYWNHVTYKSSRVSCISCTEWSRQNIGKLFNSPSHLRVVFESSGNIFHFSHFSIQIQYFSSFSKTFVCEMTSGSPLPPSVFCSRL